MGIDTVKLRSPSLDAELADRLERLSILKQGIDLFSGEELWNITTGELDGSYDSRISFRVMREDFVCDKNGTPHLQPCDPYITVEASWPKVFHGQNVYGTIDHFQDSAEWFVEVLQSLFGLADDELPYAKHWEVRRIDWAEMFDLPQAAIGDFFRCFSACKFPRRGKKTAKHGDHSMHFPGSTTTLRLYHKGPEFKEHDQARIKQSFVKYFRERFELMPIDEIYKLTNRKVKALQRLADRRLRCEVQINARKLQDDFAAQLIAEGKDRKYPKVSEITDEYLINIYQTEMQKLLKEGKSDMDTVRNHDAVRNRLISLYGKRTAQLLMAFWMNLAAQGEDIAKDMYSKSRYYANRKKLMDAGVSWHASNIYILPPQSLLPVDFQPLRNSARICQFPIRPSSLLNLCPTEYQQAVTRRAA
ncbi:MAG: phage/plasmid replication protein, II/X family [Pseudomonadota bacterium]